MFVVYLGAPDNAYIRDIARIALIAAMTRAYEPDKKFDYAVIIEGLQGRGKSTFIQMLGRNWFAELDGDFHDMKQMVELMQCAWIMEIPELSGFNRADVRAIKAFISRQEDRARLAYAKRVSEFPMQCVFIGSTNDREYLKDDTGGRRFWPVHCTLDSVNFAAFGKNVDQI
ncbi:virulence-associated E family protein [Tsuneonella mangrovi]|uniref:virulence-associated E family protein n=1 Tax=Tsuneonella mangrovi TaxID=1982042 RepID=UPI000BA2118F|nr:virulence-associated E family protein [Tsuneonella mangrovi]